MRRGRVAIGMAAALLALSCAEAARADVIQAVDVGAPNHRTWISAGGTLAVAGATAWMCGSAGRADAVSDVLEVAFPAAAIGTPLVQRNWPAVKRSALSVGVPLAMVYVLKQAIDKRRPNGTNHESYPSGHTALAFASAASLHAEYGAYVGVPAYAAAVGQGLARVRGNRHFYDDVIAGAGISLLTNWAFASWRGRAPACLRAHRWRIQFDYGVAWQDDNTIDVAGGAVDLARLGNWPDRLATASLDVSWYPDACNEVVLQLRPLTFRGASTFAQDVVFDGRRFAAGASVDVAWTGASYRLLARREVSRCPRRLSVRPGLALALHDDRVRMASAGATRVVGDPRVALLPHVQLTVPIRRALSLRAAATGIPGIAYGGFEAEAAVRWGFARGWDVELSYRWFSRELGTLRNDPVSQGAYVSFARSF